MVLSLRGGGHLPEKDKAKARKEAEKAAQEAIEAEILTEMAIAPGGFIEQTIVEDPVAAEDWDKENTIMFNVNLLNPAAFQHVLGITPPESPINAALYEEYDLPFYKIYEEPSGISGNFGGTSSRIPKDSFDMYSDGQS